MDATLGAGDDVGVASDDTGHYAARPVGACRMEAQPGMVWRLVQRDARTDGRPGKKASAILDATLGVWCCSGAFFWAALSRPAQEPWRNLMVSRHLARRSAQVVRKSRGQHFDCGAEVDAVDVHG